MNRRVNRSTAEGRFVRQAGDSFSVLMQSEARLSAHSLKASRSGAGPHGSDAASRSSAHLWRGSTISACEAASKTRRQYSRAANAIRIAFNGHPIGEMPQTATVESTEEEEAADGGHAASNNFRRVDFVPQI
jgi:hypothetical protein